VVEHLPSKQEDMISNPSAEKKFFLVRCWWLSPIILATQEAEIRKIKVQSQPRQIVLETIF
jgi:hypothetical protein